MRDFNQSDLTRAVLPVIQGASEGGFPSVCRVTLTSDALHTYTCTGTLIAPDLVLCAAHCVDAPRIRSASCIFDGNRVIAARAWFWNKAFNQEKIETNATERKRLLAVGLDYTIIQLNTPVFDIKPSPMMPLAKFEKLFKEGKITSIKAVGFGRFSKFEVNNVLAGVEKRSADFKAVSFPKGTRALNIRPSTKRRSEAVSIAVGDSGGPYFATYKGVNYIVATVSTVTPTSDGDADFATALSVDAVFDFFEPSILREYTQNIGPEGYKYESHAKAAMDSRAIESIAYDENMCVSGYCFDEKPLLYSALATVPIAVCLYVGLKLKNM